MLPMNVLIAFFLAVCIRNSESTATQMYCQNDDKVADILPNFSNGIVPILVINEKNPLRSGRGSRTLYTFMDKFPNIIVVDNQTQKCSITVDILNRRLNLYNVKSSAVYMMKDGQLVTTGTKRVTEFREVILNQIIESANNYQLVENGTIYQELSRQLGRQGNNQVVNYPGNHPGILMPQRPVGYPQGYPVGYQLGYQVENPQGYQVENQPIEQVYARRQGSPKELNLLATMENPGGRENSSGGSPQTYSQQIAYNYIQRMEDNNINNKPVKKRRLDEGPSGTSG